MPLLWILIAILVIASLVGSPAVYTGAPWGWYGPGLGTILVIVLLIYLLSGRGRTRI